MIEDYGRFLKKKAKSILSESGCAWSRSPRPYWMASISRNHSQLA